VLDGIQRKLDEVDDLRRELKEARARAASGRASELAAVAEQGVVVARIDGLSPNDLRELAIAVRQQPAVEAAVLLGESDSGGVSLVAAVQPGGRFEAAALVKDAAKAVRGGGGGKGDVATAGGKDASGLPDALRIARAAAGLPEA